MRIKKTFLIIVHFFFISYFLFTDIHYRVSGRITYDGYGIKDIEIESMKMNDEFYYSTKTDINGYFSLYLPNGIFQIDISNGKGYVSNDIFKIITVNNKNVNNVLFLLEKECKVMGQIKFLDNIGIKDCSIIVKNDRGFSDTISDNQGYYEVSEIRWSQQTVIEIDIPGVGKYNRNIVFNNEGTILRDVNFIIPNRISLVGKVIDKDTKEPIGNMLVTVIDEFANRKQLITNENGDFIFYNFIEGLHGIMFFEPSYNYFGTELRFIEKEIKELTFEVNKKVKNK